MSSEQAKMIGNKRSAIDINEYDEYNQFKKQKEEDSKNEVFEHDTYSLFSEFVIVIFKM